MSIFGKALICRLCSDIPLKDFISLGMAHEMIFVWNRVYVSLFVFLCVFGLNRKSISFLVILIFNRIFLSPKWQLVLDGSLLTLFFFTWRGVSLWATFVMMYMRSRLSIVYFKAWNCVIRRTGLMLIRSLMILNRSWITLTHF